MLSAEIEAQRLEDAASQDDRRKVRLDAETSLGLLQTVLDDRSHRWVSSCSSHCLRLERPSQELLLGHGGGWFRSWTLESRRDPAESGGHLRRRRPGAWLHLPTRRQAVLEEGSEHLA